MNERVKIAAECLLCGLTYGFLTGVVMTICGSTAADTALATAIVGIACLFIPILNRE